MAVICVGAGLAAAGNLGWETGASAASTGGLASHTGNNKNKAVAALVGFGFQTDGITGGSSPRYRPHGAPT
jgi:hypothetical protein